MLASIQIEIKEYEVLSEDKFLTWSARCRVILKDNQDK